ncbi:nose resistant to fluoxetine protein 6-like [Amphiura filiformis]|uniref:nose resistant to fluoxetine protein 6-like n=1 Tax=Amphiura filiformis TaxID=82378 RepID=UPI003B213B53
MQNLAEFDSFNCTYDHHTMAQRMKHCISWLVVIVFLNHIATTMAFTPTLGRLPSPGPYQAIDSQQVSRPCQEAFDGLVGNDSNIGTLLKVFDAMGKPAAGFLELNQAWIGHYDECMNITDFRYCTVQLQLNASKINPQLIFPISWGVCMPTECTGEDVSNAIEWVADLVHIEPYFHMSDAMGAVTVCAEDPPRPYDTGFILTVLFCSIVILLAVSGAIFGLLQRVKLPRLSSALFALQPEIPLNEDDDDDDEPLLELNGKVGNGEAVTTYIPPPKRNIVLRFLQCFSLTNNLPKLLDSKQNDRSITCLNGIRVISMFWVILGHTFICAMNIGAMENPLVGITFTQRFGFQAVGNAFFSVDTFFFLSGFLLGFLTLSRMAKSDGKIPWFWFYFHRFWRLTPVYMFTILVYMYLVPYFGEGPFWQLFVPRPICPKY